jgi:thiamine phosphate synthase YjbQ (UPF0047 family)
METLPSSGIGSENDVPVHLDASILSKPLRVTESLFQRGQWAQVNVLDVVTSRKREKLNFSVCIQE